MASSDVSNGALDAERACGDSSGVTVKPQLSSMTPSKLTSREVGSDDPATVTDVKAAVADFSWAAVPITTASDLLPLSSKSFSRNHVARRQNSQ